MACCLVSLVMYTVAADVFKGLASYDKTGAGVLRQIAVDTERGYYFTAGEARTQLDIIQYPTRLVRAMSLNAVDVAFDTSKLYALQSGVQYTLSIYNASDVEVAVPLLKQYDFTSWVVSKSVCSALYVFKDTAYVSCTGPSAVLVFSSVSTAPKYEGRFDELLGMCSIDHVRGLLYTVSDPPKVYDIQNPSEPKLLGSFGRVTFVFDNNPVYTQCDVSGDSVVFSANLNRTILVYRHESPESKVPVLVTTQSFAEWATNVCVVRHYAITTVWGADRAIRMVDISDPAQPVIVQEYVSSDSANFSDVVCTDDAVLVAEEDKVRIFSLPTTPAPPTAEPTAVPTAEPTAAPPTDAPRTEAPPTDAPPTDAPPTLAPTAVPNTANPTAQPTPKPTGSPPTSAPVTAAPTAIPTFPILSTFSPATLPPTAMPTAAPTQPPPTVVPTSAPLTPAPDTPAPPTPAPPTFVPLSAAPPSVISLTTVPPVENRTTATVPLSGRGENVFCSEQDPHAVLYTTAEGQWLRKDLVTFAETHVDVSGVRCSSAGPLRAVNATTAMRACGTLVEVVTYVGTVPTVARYTVSGGGGWTARDVAFGGTHVYVAVDTESGGSVVVLDAATMGPSGVPAVEWEDKVLSVAVSGDVLLCSTDAGKPTSPDLLAFDITSRAEPELVWRQVLGVQLSPIYATDTFLVGTAFESAGNQLNRNTLSVFTPSLTGSWMERVVLARHLRFDEYASLHSLTVVSDKVYVISPKSKILYVVDTPAGHPRVRVALSAQGKLSLAVCGHSAYVLTTDSAYVEVIELMKLPTGVVSETLSSFPLTGINAITTTTHDCGKLYVVGREEMSVVDTTDVHALRVSASAPVTDPTCGTDGLLVRADGKVLMRCGTSLSVVDFSSNFSRLQHIRIIDVYSWTHCNSYVYIALQLRNASVEIRTINATSFEKLSSSFLNNVDAAALPLLACSGDYVYAAVGTALFVLAAADAGAAEEKTRHTLPAPLVRLTASDGRLYMQQAVGGQITIVSAGPDLAQVGVVSVATGGVLLLSQEHAYIAENVNGQASLLRITADVELATKAHISVQGAGVAEGYGYLFVASSDGVTVLAGGTMSTPCMQRLSGSQASSSPTVYIVVLVLVIAICIAATVYYRRKRRTDTLHDDSSACLEPEEMVSPEVECAEHFEPLM